MPNRDELLTDHPAGGDLALYAVLEDLKLGRYRSVKELLLETGCDWQLRTFRSQVIALYAAHTRAIDNWYADDPRDPDALMMWARVLTQRTFLLHLPVNDPVSVNAVDQARRVCHAAIQARPRCPVARVCLLALAQFDADPRYPQLEEHWAPWPGVDGLPEGPWPLFWAIRQRDAENREACQRLLQFFYARGIGAHSVAQWMAMKAPECSILHMAPLYAYAEDFRQRRVRRQVSDFTYWTDPVVQMYVQRARDGWFAYLDAETSTAPSFSIDLNLLAWTLQKSGVGGAGPVFEAIGRYVTAMPWQALGSRTHWSDDFYTARGSAFKEQPAHR